MRILKTKTFGNEKIDGDFLKLVEMELALNVSHVPIRIAKDGNCLYNSIILQLITNEKLQDPVISLRLAIVYVLLENDEYFENVFQKSGSFKTLEEFIRETLTLNSWGNEYSQLALSIVLNSPIHTVSIDARETSTFSHCYCADEIFNQEKTFKLGFKVNHYVALLVMNEKVKMMCPNLINS